MTTYYNFELSDIDAYNLFKAVNNQLSAPISYVEFFDGVIINFYHEERKALTVNQVLRIFE